jgi:hypothetical protein
LAGSSAEMLEVAKSLAAWPGRLRLVHTTYRRDPGVSSRLPDRGSLPRAHLHLENHSNTVSQCSIATVPDSIILVGGGIVPDVKAVCFVAEQSIMAGPD